MKILSFEIINQELLKQIVRMTIVKNMKNITAKQFSLSRSI